ncbi:conserved hypothetical protein [Aeromicrobium sp. 9AM]|nr:conserved hypothetical protein [Aeromicrobium sp. 9AM]
MSVGANVRDHERMPEPTWTSWRESLAFLRDCATVPAALSNATTLVTAQRRWRNHVVARTSMHDLLFTRPDEEYPFTASVRVRADSSTWAVETISDEQQERQECTIGNIDRVLDVALGRLVAPLHVCRFCGETAATDHFELFEQMHWVCFHFEFEHPDFDRDEACTAPACPSAARGR